MLLLHEIYLSKLMSNLSNTKETLPVWRIKEKMCRGAAWRIHPAKLFDFKQQVYINPPTDRTSYGALSTLYLHRRPHTQNNESLRRTEGHTQSALHAQPPCTTFSWQLNQHQLNHKSNAQHVRLKQPLWGSDVHVHTYDASVWLIINFFFVY